MLIWQSRREYKKKRRLTQVRTTMSETLDKTSTVSKFSRSYHELDNVHDFIPRLPGILIIYGASLSCGSYSYHPLSSLANRMRLARLTLQTVRFLKVVCRPPLENGADESRAATHSELVPMVMLVCHELDSQHIARLTLYAPGSSWRQAHPEFAVLA